VSATDTKPRRSPDTSREIAAKHARGRGPSERHPKHQLARPPVRQVEEGVEVALHQRDRIALEISERVEIREARRRYFGARRDLGQFGPLRRG